MVYHGTIQLFRYIATFIRQHKGEIEQPAPNFVEARLNGLTILKGQEKLFFVRVAIERSSYGRPFVINFFEAMTQVQPVPGSY